MSNVFTEQQAEVNINIDHRTLGSNFFPHSFAKSGLGYMFQS